jgi:hypothetical protein
MKNESQNMGSLNKTPVGIIDSGFSIENISGPVSQQIKELGQEIRAKLTSKKTRHGTGAVNLINGRLMRAKSEIPLGAGYLAEIVSLGVYQEEDQGFTVGGMPKLINMSIGLPDGAFAKSVFSRLAKHHIIVTSAGNGYALSPRVQPLKQVSDIIRVGGVSPLGLISGGSREALDEGISIAAPGDGGYLTQTNAQRLDVFSGTSAASALVTGSLSNVMTFIPDLTTLEAKILLKRTAIPTVHARQKPPKNGPGTLNAFKLLQVAKRLHEKWEKNGVPEKNKRREALEEISIYDFEKEAQLLLNEGKRLMKSELCDDKRKGFWKLREAFFLSSGPLSSTFTESQELVARVYDSEKYSLNAQFFRNFTDEALTNTLKLAMDSDLETIRSSAVRTASILGDRGVQIIKKGIDDSESYVRQVAAMATSDFEKQGVDILKRATRLKSNTEKLVVFNALNRNQSPAAREHAKRLVQSSLFSEMRALAEEAFAQLGADSTPVLSPLLEHGNPFVRLEVVKAGLELRSDGHSILAEAARDSDVRVRRAVAEAALKLGTEAKDIITVLRNSPDLELQGTIANWDRDFRTPKTTKIK